jgi:glycosyltransferase involved in cell wall biosynthesis/SAM-dependent methyltransferase
MSVSVSQGARFRIFGNFEDVAQAAAQPPAVDFYALLDTMRQAARARQPDWATYPVIAEYASVCFWAIRKLEYAFAATQFARIEQEVSAPLRVLDVGCGVVPLCNWISRRGHRVTAIDPSDTDIDLLSRNQLNRFYRSDVAYEVGRAEELRFEDGTFDVVTCISVLEHLAPGNDRLALWEIARVLKPGGKLIITFDVSPSPLPQDGQAAWPPDRRRYAEPFSAQAADRLLGAIGAAFEVSPVDLVDQVAQLTWDDVHRFWRATQDHDGREEPLRDYLACGSVLTRGHEAVEVPVSNIAAAYQEGQAALEDRLEFYQRHADARLRLLLRRDMPLGRKRKLVHLVRDWRTPQLGVLRQYSPRRLNIPRNYMDTTAPSPAPRISIVTPSYNHGHLIGRTIDSVLAQSYPELEYIVQDGGSIDSTPAVLERYRPRLFHVASERDNGQASAINHGFTHANGEIMAWLNSDDVLLPGALNYVSRYFVDHPKVDVIYGHRVIIDLEDQEVGRWVLPPHDDHILLWGDFVPQETLFWRRRIWERAGGRLDESLLFAMDWELLLRFRAAGAVFARVPRFLGGFRIHSLQKTSANMADQGVLEMDLLRQRYLGRRVSPLEVARAFRPYFRRHLVYQWLYRLGALRY